MSASYYIDELGYLPVNRGEANFFFSLISELYEKTSIVVTSNKCFDGWDEILEGPVLAEVIKYYSEKVSNHDAALYWGLTVRNGELNYQMCLDFINKPIHTLEGAK